MRKKPKGELILSDNKREQRLALTVPGKTVQALALRARIVLACAEGTNNKTVVSRQRVIAQTQRRIAAVNSGSFCALSSANVPADLDVHLVMDNCGTHKTAVTERWLARHPRFHVHFTPTSASWLNQLKRWFATLTQRCVGRGSHCCTRELEQALHKYIEINNAAPRPFVWTKSVDQILAGIKRFCMRISDSLQ
jgi:hypothetical protein